MVVVAEKESWENEEGPKSSWFEVTTEHCRDVPWDSPGVVVDVKRHHHHVNQVF